MAGTVTQQICYEYREMMRMAFVYFAEISVYISLVSIL